MEREEQSTKASAFGAPEGGYVPNPDNPGQEGGQANGQEGGGQQGNQPAGSEGGQEGGQQNPDQGAGGQQEAGNNGQQGEQQSGQTGLNYENLFNKAAEKLGIDTPKEIENDPDKLMQFVIDNAKKPSEEGAGDQTADSIHPEAKRFNEALQAGKKPEEFFKEYTEPSAELNMPDDQFMFSYLKKQNGKSEENENGWSDEQIQSQIDRMKESGLLEKEAFELKQKRKEQIESERSQQQQQEQQRQTEQQKEVERKQKEAIDSLMSEVDKIDQIGGMDVSQEDHKEFKEVFSNLLQPVSEDSNVRSLDLLLHDNKELYKMLYMYYNGTNKFNKALTEAKENVKNQFVKKLNLNPDVGSGQSQEPKTVDVSKFASPEM